MIKTVKGPATEKSVEALPASAIASRPPLKLAVRPRSNPTEEPELTSGTRSRWGSEFTSLSTAIKDERIESISMRVKLWAYLYYKRQSLLNIKLSESTDLSFYVNSYAIASVAALEVSKAVESCRVHRVKRRYRRKFVLSINKKWSPPPTDTLDSRVITGAIPAVWLFDEGGNGLMEMRNSKAKWILLECPLRSGLGSGQRFKLIPPYIRENIPDLQDR
ncbi:hypothetical protein EVAR_84668_1 [Eumeta japonica]|uniref:Uncharacterized protein n=1 Tax=Eumeta variegata TaxID=151549 RepID=A0A4C1UZW7_EUMVA|nr:hypothetical protein EVAR_84668_1 [Eumeta japonica]